MKNLIAILFILILLVGCSTTTSENNNYEVQDASANDQPSNPLPERAGIESDTFDEDSLEGISQEESQEFAIYYREKKKSNPEYKFVPIISQYIDYRTPMASSDDEFFGIEKFIKELGIQDVIWWETYTISHDFSNTDILKYYTDYLVSMGFIPGNPAIMQDNTIAQIFESNIEDVTLFISEAANDKNNNAVFVIYSENTAGKNRLSSRSNPKNCVIKGNIGFETGEKIYHIPGQKYYDETIINPDYGERWFCTEEEAQGAGWRKAWE